MSQFIGNNLHNNISEWEKLVHETGSGDHENQWMKEGVKIPLKTIPDPFNFPNTKTFNSRESTLLHSEINNLVKLKCVRQANYIPYGVSPISVVPKKGSSYRLIIDLRHLNSFCERRSMVYEDIKQVIEVAQPEDYIITTDIKNGFFHIGIHKEYQQYPGFTHNNKYYVWLVLPFGASFSPYFFSKTLRPVVQYLRLQNLKTVCYVDDFIVFDSESQIIQKRDVLINTLHRLGIIINYDKSQLAPKNEQKFIGYIINTTKERDKIWLQIPKERIKSLKHDIRRALKVGRVSARAKIK